MQRCSIRTRAITSSRLESLPAGHIAGVFCFCYLSTCELPCPARRAGRPFTACRVGIGAALRPDLPNLQCIAYKTVLVPRRFHHLISRLFFLALTPSSWSPRPASTLVPILSRVALQSRKCLTQVPPDRRPLSSRACDARHPPFSRVFLHATPVEAPTNISQ